MGGPGGRNLTRASVDRPAAVADNAGQPMSFLIMMDTLPVTSTPHRLCWLGFCGNRCGWGWFRGRRFGWSRLHRLWWVRRRRWGGGFWCRACGWLVLCGIRYGFGAGTSGNSCNCQEHCNCGQDFSFHRISPQPQEYCADSKSPERIGNPRKIFTWTGRRAVPHPRPGYPTAPASAHRHPELPHSVPHGHWP